MTDRTPLEMRGRALEEEYFRRRDAETMARLDATRAENEARRRDEEAAAALATAMGLRSQSVGREALLVLAHAGVTPAIASVVEWLPAVEVAWLGGVDPEEGRTLHGLVGAGGPAPAAVDAVELWSRTRPDDALFMAGRVVLREQLATLEPTTAAALIDRVMHACDLVAGAAGGWLGLGRSSTEERSLRDAIRAELVPTNGHPAT